MSDRGYTVVEVLVALILFSIIVLPIADLFVAESRFNKKYEQKIVSMMVAQNELEKAKQAIVIPQSDEYTVSLYGKEWRVKRTVSTVERSISSVTDTNLKPLQGLPQKEMASSKTFITVSVRRENDTGSLCEFRVMKETYQ